MARKKKEETVAEPELTADGREATIEAAPEQSFDERTKQVQPWEDTEE